MRLVLRIFFTTVLLISATSAFAACEGRLPSGHQNAINPSNPDLSTFSATVRFYTNVERCRRGVPPLKTDPGLLNAATVHSTFMAGSRNMTHKSNVRGYRTLKDRMRTSKVSMRTAGENIGQNFLYALAGQNISLKTRGRCKFTYADSGLPVPQHSYSSLAKELVASWIASPNHYTNIINRKFTRMEASFGFSPDDATCGWIFASQNFAG